MIVSVQKRNNNKLEINKWIKSFPCRAFRMQTINKLLAIDAAAAAAAAAAGAAIDAPPRDHRPNSAVSQKDKQAD